MSQTRSNYQDFREGCRDCLPLMTAGVPIGLTCGLVSIAAGFNLPETAFMSAVVFSGAAQFIALSTLVSANASPMMLTVNTLLVSLPNLLLTASLAPHMTLLPKPLRSLLAFTISEGTYAITMNRVLERGYSAYYQLGASAVQYVFWIGSNITGAAIGSRIPNPLSLGLDFTLTAVFIAILIPKLKDRTSLCVSIASALTALLGASYLGGKLFILIAAAAGIITGILMERRTVNAR